MSDDVSISDLPVKFNGHSFTLRATQEALATVELELGESYAVPYQRMVSQPPRLTDVTSFFAAFALPHGRYNAVAIRKFMPFDGGESLIELRDNVVLAIAKAMPKPKETTGTEGGSKADSDPTA